ncbi:hypothetical protein E0I26_06270 [Flavobacterium rhamnosiphilum]|uniref:Mannosylglycerate hydrolase MGH1-like glycoside hydrolase domain-containing protein n=1 Tax=Flavobacterium rhamnosiphilum TaxID=2541724 RepID=A0A4R5FA09_9FLAO|nr:trehalase family glycosidase [Flavobacterium rhamnosiphilum]TDE45550.1 hypothetical protein E0I26_06270 [Flavobacterium rhamnosiphilum]
MNRRDFIIKNVLASGVFFLPSSLLAFEKTLRGDNVPFDRSFVPEPIMENDNGFIDLYYKAWELAYSHIKTQANLPASPYMDEAFDDSTIWIWDTCFMVQFCKYAPAVFPGIQSLNNFYAPIHDHIEIPLRIEIIDNPPLFAWTESEYFKFTNDHKHLEELLLRNQYLQKHFDWFDTTKPGKVIADSAPSCLEKVEHGYHWEGGRSGMDNTPRGRTGKNATKSRPNNPKMLWIDAIAQQGLSSLCVSRLFKQLGNKEMAAKWKATYNKIKTTVNEFYWDETDGFYYDINEDTLEPIKVVTPASYWPMLAEMCSAEQAKKMVDKIKDSNVLGGIVPWVSLARNDADFKENGNYWRGSVWLPLAYMGIKSLEKYNYLELAHQNAYDTISHMEKTYREFTPHTIWECYNPVEPKPATNEHANNGLVRPDFCGWSALGAISLLIENVLGFYDINAATKTIKWNKVRTDRHGIHRLKFGTVITDIIAFGNKIEISSNEKYTLIVNGKAFKIAATEKQLFSL